jgi:hypothetical protein
LSLLSLCFFRYNNCCRLKEIVFDEQALSKFLNDLLLNASKDCEV